MNVILDLDYTTPYRGQPVLIDWLRALGVDPKDVRRVVVNEDDAGHRTVEITNLARNQAGKFYLATGEAVAEDPPFVVPLTAKIPDQILAQHRVPAADATPSMP